MTGRRATPLARTVAVLALLGAAAPAASQEIAGMAVGPEGQPLVGTPVVLHRVGGEGGAFVATDTTAENGTFRFGIEPPDSAIYFAAIRYEGRLYVGPAARAGMEPVTGYVLRVEPGTEVGAFGTGIAGPATPAAVSAVSTRAAGSNDTGAVLLVALLALSTVAVFIVAAPRYRRRRTREALVEVATVENRLAGGEPGDPAERGELEARRDALRELLAPRG